MIQVSGRIGILEMERLIIILAIIISLTACESSQIEKSTDNESSVENSESNQDQIVENNTSIKIVQENDNLTYEEKKPTKRKKMKYPMLKHLLITHSIEKMLERVYILLLRKWIYIRKILVIAM